MQVEKISEWEDIGNEVGENKIDNVEMRKVKEEEERRKIEKQKKVMEDMIGKKVKNFC